MAEAIEFLSLELKCDAAGCNHVEAVAGMTADQIGKKCPKCGADMLTREDFEQAKYMESAIGLMNAGVGPVDAQKVVDAMHISINPHNGRWNINAGRAS